MADKAPDALRTIGEVSRELGVRTHVLRYWEEHFPMLMPLKRAGGRRYYRPEDVALVRQIDSLVNQQGFTVKGAVSHLRSNGRTAPPKPVNGLQAIRDQLAQALRAA